MKFKKEKQKPQSLERISRDEYRQLLKDKIISVVRMRYNWQRKKNHSISILIRRRPNKDLVYYSKGKKSFERMRPPKSNCLMTSFTSVKVNSLNLHFGDN